MADGLNKTPMIKRLKIPVLNDAITNNLERMNDMKSWPGFKILQPLKSTFHFEIMSFSKKRLFNKRVYVILNEYHNVSKS